ncbi:aminotransferase class V-fold PLP-dependent enzyme [Hoeflea sp.]|uniref:aminotransferase class V-fold PLP-dependent enzyme n=1 Tax=Hoeflea sp. TaxID=1940281 RepID=UPI0019A23740|nr:aminotransferase class V-fold PLP-dependent enzyme [Hoeflea sp.]MBC7282209.1 aminotransferase class V-fold PLP-dependent enzyme [Hoeflea sp.]
MSHPVSQWNKSSEVRDCPSTLSAADADALIAQIRSGVIGEGRPISTPFGIRPLVYADYVASGRGLSFIEDFVRDQVLPDYGNTHTETSHTGRQTTVLRETARETIRRAVGADQRHAVIFTGSGATSAANKLVRALQLQALLPHRALAAGLPEDELPVVFVGPYEHHSNDLPWRETGARIRRIPLNAAGGICLDTLARELAGAAAGVPKLGVFSAASNVTGIKTDVRAIARLLHAHGARFFCDYAAGAPYMPIAIGETAPGRGDHIDALFLSPHKFVGGPGASGLLVSDKAIFEGIEPTMTGGGTVSYVTSDGHCYVSSVERREEAGTPNIVGDIKTGLVLELKDRVGAREIERREADIVAKAMRSWAQDPNIELLGPLDAERIGVFAFNIRCGSKKLHYGLVVALLNDLFGIQARGGCSCAGPYGHELLGIDETDAMRHQEQVRGGQGVLRPGWVRLGFNYFFDDRTTHYIIDAVRFVAAHGAAFLSLYRVNSQSGVWTASAIVPPAERPASLLDMLATGAAPRLPEVATAPGFAECLAAAAQLAVAQEAKLGDLAPVEGGDGGEADSLRWFWRPEELPLLRSQLIAAAKASIHQPPSRVS